MNDFMLVVNYFFDTFANFFNLLTSHWLLSLFVVFAIMSFIVNLFLMVKGTK